MIKNLLQKTYIPLIIIGVITITTYMIFGGLVPTLIESHSIQYGSYTWNYYTFNVNQYLINLKLNFSTDILELSYTNPPELPTQVSSWDVSKYLQYIINILIYVANWLIWIINIVLFYPLKLLMYPVRLIYTLIGLNTSDFEFTKAIETLATLNIKYIQYINF